MQKGFWFPFTFSASGITDSGGTLPIPYSSSIMKLPRCRFALVPSTNKEYQSDALPPPLKPVLWKRYFLDGSEITQSVILALFTTILLPTFRITHYSQLFLAIFHTYFSFLSSGPAGAIIHVLCFILEFSEPSIFVIAFPLPIHASGMTCYSLPGPQIKMTLQKNSLRLPSIISIGSRSYASTSIPHFNAKCSTPYTKFIFIPYIMG